MIFITGNPWLSKELRLMNLKNPKASEGWVDPLNMTGILGMQNPPRFTRVPGDLLHPELPPSQGERPGLASAATPTVHLNSFTALPLSTLTL